MAIVKQQPANVDSQPAGVDCQHASANRQCPAECPEANEGGLGVNGWVMEDPRGATGAQPPTSLSLFGQRAPTKLSK